MLPYFFQIFYQTAGISCVRIWHFFLIFFLFFSPFEGGKKPHYYSVVDESLSHIFCPSLNPALPRWVIALSGKKDIYQERKNMYLKKEYLSFSISCLSLHYCMSSKPREHCTCMKVTIHTPCLFGNIITLCKNKPRALPQSPMKVTVQLQEKHMKNT